MVDVTGHHYCNYPICKIFELIVSRPDWQLRRRFSKCQLDLGKRTIIQLVEHIVTSRIFSFGLKLASIQCVRGGNLSQKFVLEKLNRRRRKERFPRFQNSIMIFTNEKPRTT
jgi:hypothetical protein